MTLRARPITIKAAKLYNGQWHRHLKGVVGGLFAIAAVDDELDVGNDVVGVLIVGRPIARLDQDGWTAEVVRCATNGHRNANSFLYSIARRVAQTLGYRRLLTKTLPSESGSSLKALRLTSLGLTKGGEHSRKSRPRKKAVDAGPKVKWDLLQKAAP